jgi:hypothetical protein|tara:strand:+ start:316 stop:498 length:183 start_codon:yes stop_codon:yes gene_type:complete
MLKLLKPILLGLFSEKIIKQLIIDILRLLVKKTSNDLDDRAVDFLEQQLFPGRKLTQLPR